MHELTRQRLLGVLFLSLCVLPTLGVVAAAIIWKSSLPERWVSRHVALRLGMDVQVREFRSPRLHRYVLIDTQLADPETGRQQLVVPEIIATRHPAGWRLEIPRMSLQLADVPTVLRLFHDRIIRTELQLERPILAVRCDQLEIDCPDDSSIGLQKLAWVRAADPELWHESRLSFFPADAARADGSSDTIPTAVPEVSLQALPTPVTLELRRNRQTARAHTELEFDPAGHEISVTLLAACFGKTYLGDTRFRTEDPIRITVDGQGYSADVRGYVNGIDISRLAPKWLPAGSRGKADVRFTLFVSQHGLEPGSILGIHASQVVVPRDAVMPLVDHRLARVSEQLLSDPEQDFEADVVRMALWIQADDMMVCLALPKGQRVFALRDNRPLMAFESTYTRLDDLVQRMARDVKQSTEHVAKLRRLLSL